MEALKYYFDCIMGPFKPYVLKAIDKIKDLPIDIICPGHGPILREDPWNIVNKYKEWSLPKKMIRSHKSPYATYQLMAILKLWLKK